MSPSEKDFDTWNEEMKRIQAHESHKTYKEGEVWWCALGLNIGSEQNGTSIKNKRPVLVLKKINRQTCYVIPLTTSIKKGTYKVPIGMIDGKEAMALMSQIRLIDTKRLIKVMEIVDPCLFLYMREAARNLF